MEPAHPGRAPDSVPIISISDLRMVYGSKIVLDGLDLDINADEIVAMLGPNGAGKSTTIEILEGFPLRLKRSRQMAASPTAVPPL
jgi:ABC-type branched-subunit amino acid transport system ATPase component